jgi:hypothetical protein
MELLYFSDISQLDYVLESNPKLLQQMRPITGDMVVSYELERMHIDYIDEWDFIEPEEIEANWNTAYLLSKSWWDEGLASTKYGIEALTESVQQDLVYPFQTCLNARTAYDKIFNSFPIKKISGYFLPEVAVIRTGPAPTSRAVQSVSQAVLFFLASQRGIPVDKLYLSRPLSLGKLSGLGGGAEVNVQFSKQGTSHGTNKSSVIVFQDGLRQSEHLGIMKALKSLPDVMPISLSLQDLKAGVGFKNTPSYVESKLSAFWNEFRCYSDSYNGLYPEIFCNPFLRFQFDRIRTEMQDSVDYGDIFDAFLDVLKPSIVIFGFESFTIERVLVRIAQSRKIFTIGMLHGGVMPIMAIRSVTGPSDAHFLWSEMDVQAISNYGAYSLKKIGCIQYEDMYFNYVEKRRTQQLPSNKNIAKNNLKLDLDRPVIMLVTAEINTGFAAAVAYPHKHRDAIREFLLWVDARRDLQFVIKPHPSYDYYELYRRLLDVNRPNLKFLEQTTLDEVIEASDLCLMINYCTTASLEAMLHQIPVVYLNNAVYPLTDWRDNLSEAGVTRVESIEKLDVAVDKLLFCLETKQFALMAADKQIRELIGVEKIAASQQFINSIRPVLDSQGGLGTYGLSSAQAIHDFLLENNQRLPNALFLELASAHTNKSLMFVFAHMAGLHNLRYGSMLLIYKLFYNRPHDCVLKAWESARWDIFPVYISAFLGNLKANQFSISNLKLLFPYLLHPQQVISAPVVARNNLIKYLLRNLLGQQYSAVLQVITCVRKRYFGLIG